MSLDDLHAVGWRDFLLWAWSEPEMRERFTAATGIESLSIRAPIHTAIDKAVDGCCGIAADFIEWATRTHWGLEHAPRAYQETLAARAIAAKLSPTKGAKP